MIRKYFQKLSSYSFFLIFLLHAETSHSQANSVAGAQSLQMPLCLGYNSDSQQWGGLDSKTNQSGLCAPGSAFMSVLAPYGEAESAEQYPIVGFCCPLPSGALSERHQFLPQSCPPLTLITGFISDNKDGHLFRCTEVNQDRFELGPRREGSRLEYAEEIFSQWGNEIRPGNSSPRVNWANIPVAIRSGISRLTRTSWSWDTCLGQPVGAFLVGRTGKSCREHEFQELRMKAPPGPSQSIPFPDCRAIDHPLSPDGRCIPQSENHE